MENSLKIGALVKIPRIIDMGKATGLGDSKALHSWGRIVWIHPENRYAVVRFMNGRECYSLQDLMKFESSRLADAKEREHAMQNIPYDIF